MMADSLPSPPTSRPHSPTLNLTANNNIQTLEHIDTLLEQYLELLDQYTTLRDELSRHLSSGFFSLAQAQRTSNLGAGRRYGQDCYDERMKASRSVHIISDENDKAREIEIKHTGSKQVSEEHSVEENVKTNEEGVKSSKRYDKSGRDPLKWFGILSPPALKRTQTEFVHVVDDYIPALLNVSARMATLEVRITQARREMSLAKKVEELDIN